MGDDQIAVSGLGSVEPALPRLPPLLSNSFNQSVVFLSASRKEESTGSQEASVSSKPSLNVRGCCFVHPHVKDDGSLGWRGGRHGRQDRASIITDGFARLLGEPLKSVND